MANKKRISSKLEDQGNRAFPKIALTSPTHYEFRSNEEDGLNSEQIKKLKQKNALTEFTLQQSNQRRPFVDPPFPLNWIAGENNDPWDVLELEDLKAGLKDDEDSQSVFVKTGTPMYLYAVVDGAVTITARRQRVWTFSDTPVFDVNSYDDTTPTFRNRHNTKRRVASTKRPHC